MSSKRLSTKSLLDLIELFERSHQPLVDVEGQVLRGVPGWDLPRMTALSPEALEGWADCVGYAGSFPAACGDERIPVDIEEDEDPSRYRYRCPESFRLRFVDAVDVAVYAVRPAILLGTVADLLDIPQAMRKGIESPAIDGVLWHRVSRNDDDSPFVVQTGGFTREGEVLVEKEALFDPVEGEPGNGVSNQTGTIAMALIGNDPDSGTSQFFVNIGDNSFLDETFTVFGEVIEGMDIIEAMAQVETGEADLEGGGQLSEVPIDDITILSLRRVEPSPTAQGE